MDESAKLTPIPKLSKRMYISYGFGHMLNDLTSSIWFSYLIVFFHYVLRFSNSDSGLMLLIGQVADGIATPIVGILSDKGAGHWMCKYGHRKSWHLIGTLCVASTFPFIYSPCIGFEYLGIMGKIFYYSTFIVIFQFGWAAVQISHLSLAADLTHDQHERTKLLTIRYAFAVLSNILVHLFTWIMFVNYRDEGTTGVVTTEDSHKFQIVALFSVAIGSVCSMVFHVGVNENVSNSDEKFEDCTITDVNKKKVIVQCGLYHIMAVYTMSQLFVNQSQVFIPLYLEEYLHIEAQRLPVLPLIMYVSSSLTSYATKNLNINYGRKAAYGVGSISAVLICLVVYFGEGTFYTTYLIYFVIAVFGSASAIIMVTSLGITADLIGEHTTHGAFVYGLMSFADKMSNGIAVMIIQYLKMNYPCADYYRNVLILMCGGSAAIGSVCVLTLPKDLKLFKREISDVSKKEKMGKIVYCLETDYENTKNNTSMSS